MKVILSTDVTHYQHAALAAQADGCLQRFITGIALVDPWQHSLIHRLPCSWQSRLQGRTCSGLDPKLVATIWLPEGIARLMSLSRAFKATEIPIRIHNWLYDRLSSYYVDECSIFHYVSTQGRRAAHVARKKGAIVVVDERGAHPRYQEKILRPVYERLGIRLNIPSISYADEREKDYEIADYVIVASEFVKRSLVCEGVAGNKILVLPLGVDIGMFHALEKTDCIFRVLYVGRVVPSKGVQDLIAAYSSLALPNSQLRIVGSVHPSMSDYLNSISNMVSCGEHVPQTMLQHEYANASVVVLPSYSDGFGMVAAEAMACGKPVIITTNCGVVVEDGIHGFVVSPGDASALADRIQVLYQDEALCKEMGEAARIHAQQFTWQHYGQKLIEIYHSIMSKKDRLLP